MTRSGIPLSGSLERISVTSLLQVIMAEGLSGCLVVSRGRITRSLFVKDGMIIYAMSSERQDRLGEILVAQGSVTREEVKRAFEKARHNQTRLGMILLVEGRITSQELFQGVTAQMVAILDRMRSWRKGGFEFIEDAEPEAGSVLLRIPLALYLRGRERARPPKRREEERPAAAGEAPPEQEEEIVIEEAPEEAPEEAGEVPAGPPEAAVEPYGESVIPEEEEEPEEEREKFIQELAFHVQELRQRSGKDPYILLGVNHTAPAEEVQDAFHYLARLFHPDQHPSGTPEELSAEAAKLFREITGAYEKITASGGPPPADPGKVPIFTGRVLAHEAAIDEGDALRELFFKARRYMSKGNYWQAADALRHVVRKKPHDAMYRNLLGLCLMQTGRRLHEAEEHIKEAIRLDPGNPDYITSLGLIYKEGRFFTKARGMFQQALLYDKNHQQARQELKKLPREAEATRKTGAFWSRIFGR